MRQHNTYWDGQPKKDRLHSVLLRLQSTRMPDTAGGQYCGHARKLRVHHDPEVHGVHSSSDPWQLQTGCYPDTYRRKGNRNDSMRVQWGATPRWKWTPLLYNNRDNPIKTNVKWRKPETKGHRLQTQFCSETGHTNSWRQKKIAGRWGCSSSNGEGITGAFKERLTVQLLAPYEASRSSSRKTCTFLYRHLNQSKQTHPWLLPRSPQQWRQRCATGCPGLCHAQPAVSGTLPLCIRGLT